MILYKYLWVFHSYRCHAISYHRHGPSYVGCTLVMHRCVLYSFWWSLLCGLYGCHPADLHFHRTLDVHSVCMGKRTCQRPIVDRCRLDWACWRKAALVLSRLWTIVGVRRYSVASVFPTSIVKQNGWSSTNTVVRRCLWLFADGYPSRDDWRNRQSNS